MVIHLNLDLGLSLREEKEKGLGRSKQVINKTPHKVKCHRKSNTPQQLSFSPQEKLKNTLKQRNMQEHF